MILSHRRKAFKAGETLIEEYVVTAGNILVDLTSTGMVFDSAASPINLALYAGNDTDSTPYRIELIDSGGKVASFFVGAAGGGVTYDVELIDNPDMETGDPPTSWIGLESPEISSVADERTGGSGSKSADVKRVSEAQSPGIYQLASTGLNQIFKCSGWAKVVDIPGAITFYVFGDIRRSTTSTSWVELDWSGTRISETFLNSIFLVQGASFGEGGLNKSFRIDDCSMKIYTDVPITGIHAITEQNGSTRGMTSIDAGFDPNAIVGIRVYEQVIESEYEITLNADVHADMSATGMLFIDSRDLRPYAGADADDTPFKLVAVDGAGKSAAAYIGGAGVGLTYGANLLAGWNLTSGWVPNNATIDNATTFTSSTTTGFVGEGGVLTVGGLFKGTLATNQATASLRNGYSPTLAVSGSNDIKTAVETGIRIYTGAVVTVQINTLVIERLTDVPATGIHCLTTKNGSTRGWTSIESGFNPNTIASITIYPA